VAAGLLRQDGGAGNTASDSSSSSASGATHQQQQQQALVYELNSSGRYLAIKERLKPLVADVARERYGRQGSTAQHPTQAQAQVQQLHHELYAHLVKEVQAALAQLKAQEQQAVQQQQQQQQQEAPATAGQRPLQLAVECEMTGHLQRAHTLHLRHLAAAPSADVSACC
jgi:hypothetical protein